MEPLIITAAVVGAELSRDDTPYLPLTPVEIADEALAAYRAGAAMVHLPWLRLVVRANTNDRNFSRRPPFCSQAVAMAERIGGRVDPVPQLADRLTEPADLARSPFYRYRFTLSHP